MCRVEIILIVFFLWSLFILFFCLGKKIRWSIYFVGQKKTIVQKVAAFEREKKKIGFILRTLYKAFTAGGVVQKGRRL